MDRRQKPYLVTRRQRNFWARVSRNSKFGDSSQSGCLAASCIEFVKAFQDFMNLFLPGGQKGKRLCLVGFLLSFSIFLTANRIVELASKSIPLNFRRESLDTETFIESVPFEAKGSINKGVITGGNTSEPRVFLPNCDAILRGDDEEIFHTKTMMFREHRTSQFNTTFLPEIKRNCSNYKVLRGYPAQPASEEERQFPLAYIITVHKNVEQLEILLLNIYAPQNIYCIHVDKKCDIEFQNTIVNLVTCFDNVFVASKLETIQYAGISRLMADVNCMEDLLKTSVRWKYALNLAGQDFPLKTNYEIVQSLQNLKEKNDIPGVKPPNEGIINRYKYIHEVKDSKLRKTSRLHMPVMKILNIYFGSAYYAVTRAFVVYVVHSGFARELLHWFRDTYSPDEFYWATLHRRAGTPGGVMGDSWKSSIRVIKWSYYENKLYPPCAGHYVRNVCVFGIGDLSWLTKQPHLFANKFDIGSDHMAVSCLEYWLSKKLATKPKLLR